MITTATNGTVLRPALLPQVKVPQNALSICEELGFRVPGAIQNTGKFVGQEVVTPEQAGLILEKYHISNNRNKRSGQIAKYICDMTAGEWVPTHQGIAFNEQGLLYDGQNRLKACIDADVPFETLVFFNCPDRGMSRTDLVGARSVLDAAKIEGRHTTKSQISLARVLVWGAEFGVQLPAPRVFVILEECAELLEFLHKAFPSHIPGKTTASVLGAIGRAWFYEPAERMAEFCKCFSDGFVSDPSDGAAGLLLSWLNRQVNGRTGHHFHHDCYLKTQQAVSHFVRRSAPTKLVVPSGDLYPLPDTLRDRWLSGVVRK